MHGNKRLLTDVLRGELGFTGLIVSDWNGIDELPGDRDAHVERAINAGIDMVMAPDSYRPFIVSLKKNVSTGRVSQARIDDAVRRILVVKFRLGVFERPFGDPALLADVGSAAHREVARQAVRESQVLLVNKNRALPIAAGVTSIAVAGKAADDIGMQCGGWTITWQGAAGRITDGTTVLQAIKKAAPRRARDLLADRRRRSRRAGRGCRDRRAAVRGDERRSPRARRSTPPTWPSSATLRRPGCRW